MKNIILFFLFIISIKSYSFENINYKYKINDDGSLESILLLFILPSIDKKTNWDIPEQYLTLNFKNELISYYKFKRLGDVLPKNILINLNFIKNITENKKAASINLKYTIKKEDVYFYLIKEDNQWKINALRGLVIPGIIFEFIFPRQCKMMKLSDNQLILFFNNNKNKFESINRIMSKLNNNISIKYYSQTLSIEPSCNINNSDKKILEKNIFNLNLYSIHEYNGLIYYSYGGILDNELGFFYNKNGVVPVISEDKYIIIIELEDSWYLYKTT